MRATPNDTTQPKEILFIEGNVSDYQTLLNAAQPDIEIHLLDANQDGLAQMAQILAGRSGIGALHIVSHGGAGTLNLGALQLSTQNLPAYSATLSAIGSTLSPGADILLYGCDVAQGSAGAALIEALAQATQADIAASTDRTGAAALGGNWVLEALARASTSDGIQTPLAFDAAAVQGWNQTLEANTRYLFATSDSTNGNELWISDGTTAGTMLLKDIYSGTSGSIPNGFFSLGNGKVIFQANDGVNGQELWVTDGTTAGTQLLKDINPGFNKSSPTGFTAIGNNKIIFQADNGTEGSELWVTDGTSAGTTRIKDITTGSLSSFPTGFVKLSDNVVVFYANDSTNGQELWVTDGTTAGTQLLKNINTEVAPFVDDSAPRSLTLLGNGKAIFNADDSGGNRELWVTDGTLAGTKIVPLSTNDTGQGIRQTTTFNHSVTSTTLSDLPDDGAGSNPSGFAALGNGRAVFSANNSTNVYVTHPSLDGLTFVIVLEYAGAGRELWITDGISTKLLKNIYADFDVKQASTDADPYLASVNSSNPLDLTSLGDGRVLFTANNGSSGRELWITDGTEIGTKLLKDIRSGIAPSFNDPTEVGYHPPYFTALGNGKAIFIADDGSNGRELWVSDGTAEGTMLLKDVNTGSGSSNPVGITRFSNGKAFFSATNSTGGTELWMTDGTTAGTVLVKAVSDAVYSFGELVLATPTTTVSLQQTSVPSSTEPPFLEGNAASTLMNFTVQLSGNPASTVTVDYATADGTNTDPTKNAKAGSDYSPVNGTLVFAPGGPLTKTISVPILGDTNAELNENFTLTLSNVNGAVLSGSTSIATATITDDDKPKVSLSSATASITEGNSDSQRLKFTVNLSGPTSDAVTVNYATTDGTATTADNDYVGISGTLGFASGETSKEIFVPILGDSKAESDETFTLTLSNVSTNAEMGSISSATGKILNEDSTAVLTLSSATASVSEGDSGSKQLDFTVNLSGTATSTVTVNYTTADGSATAGSDYTAASGTLSFAVGETSKTISVPVLGDTTAETDETFTLTLSSPVGASLGGTASTTATITNDDISRFVTIAPTSALIDEGDSGSKQQKFTITLSAASTSAVTVNYATVDGTATAGSDYSATSGTLGYAPGETSKDVIVPILGDTIAELGESFTLALSSPNGATLGTDQSATVTIQDNDMPVIAFLSTTSTITEGASGSKLLNFTINLSGTTASAVTVNYITADGTATAGSDYTSVNGTLGFAPGEISKTISVPILGDTIGEANETFTLTLSNPNGAIFLANTSAISATATITNDDTPFVSLASSTTSISEGDSGSSQLNFTVNLSNAAASEITVNYATADGTAVAGSDYVSTKNTLGFAPGETSKTISVPILGDTSVESDETFTLTLSTPSGAVLGSVASTTATIKNDDKPVVTLTPTTVSVTEGNSGSKQLDFTVNLSIAASSSITVNYATANGTASAGSDYTSVSGTVGFAPGETSRTISVPILGDTSVEGDETFTLALSNPSGAVLGSFTSATATISNDDILVTISPASNAITEGDSGSQNLSFTVSLSSASSSTVSVKYVTADGSASAGTDYTSTSGTLSFAPGETGKVINVPILGDTNVEDNETFTLTLNNASNAVLGSPASATATIVNNDNSGVSIFSSTDKTNGSELWATDSTGTGTVLLKDINPGSANSTPSGFTPLANGKAIFQANDGSNGAELWITDGTQTGTVLLKNIYGGPNGSTPDGFTPLGNGKVLFRANDGNNGTEPWITDGTSAGTKLIKNIASAASSSSNPTGFTSIGDGKAIFQASDGSNGTELWVTDGTDAGTTQLKDIYAGANGSGPSGFTALGNGKFVFSANDGTKGSELWVTDGKPDGTRLVKDIYKDANGSGPSGFAMLGNGKTLFSANDGSNGNELWITDGSETGTKLLKDIYTGSSSSNPGGFSPFGKDNKFLFQATDGGNGTELWITDGTEAGTALLKDIYPGANNSSQPGVIGLFTPLGNGKTLFSATNGSNGFELWITDGTSSGTSLVKDIYTGSNGTNPAISSNPVGMSPLGNGKAIFAAATKQDTFDQLVYGLWITDGTSAGTQLVKDISGLEPIHTFSKLTNTSGAAPTINLSPISPAIIEGNSGSQQLDFLVSLSTAASSAVTVNYATANDTATAGSDYTALSGSLTFAPGETSKIISVAITGDTTSESDEKFTLTLSNPSGGTFGNSSTTAVIMNDDGGSTASSAAVPGTLGNDFLLPSAGANYLGGGGNDTYIISAKTLSGAVIAKITDTEGSNVIQLVDGLKIASSSFLNNSVQLTLDNGASVQIMGASGFSYLVGANAPAGDTASNQTYATFAATLGASVPADSSTVSGTSYTVPSGVTPASTPVPGTTTTPSTVPGTLGNDFFLPSGGNNYFGGGGNDTYIISPYTLNGSVTAKIVDTEGANVIQLVDGLVIASSSFHNNAVQLTLSNGASVQILGAAAFSYQVGANAPSGDMASSQTYAQFASTLGGSVPAAGATATSGTANYQVPIGSTAIQMPDTEGSSGDSIPVVGLVGLDGLVGFDTVWW